MARVSTKAANGAALLSDKPSFLQCRRDGDWQIHQGQREGAPEPTAEDHLPPSADCSWEEAITTDLGTQIYHAVESLLCCIRERQREDHRIVLANASHASRNFAD
jgi:hypothetical protein